jgi:hypothetical protein
MISNVFFDFKGWRFYPPFYCMCCGVEVSQEQWAFGRYCGVCDTGACRRGNLHTFSRRGVYYGNAELIDAIEAKEFMFTPDRMLKIGEIEPETWLPNKGLEK